MLPRPLELVDSSRVTVGGTLRLVYRYVRPQRGRFALVVVASLLDMALSAAISLSFKFLIDRAIGQKDQRTLYYVAGGLTALIVCVAIGGFWRDRVYANLTSQVAATLRDRMFVHLQRLSIGYHMRSQASAISARFTRDLVDIEKTVLNGVPWGIIPLLDALVSTILIFTLDARLACIALLAFPLAILGPNWLSKPGSLAAQERKQRETALTEALQENLAAQSLIKAFGLGNMAHRAFHALNCELRAVSDRLGFLMLAMERSSGISTQVLQVLVIVTGGLMVFRGGMTVGTFAAFQALFVTLVSSVSYLAQYLPQIVEAGGGMVRIEELLSEPVQVLDSPDAVVLGPLSEGIEFRDVSFGYDSQRQILSSVNLRIPRGSSVAFVGPSGSGKSTILTLAMRFYDPLSGSIGIDGLDLRKISQESLRSRLGVVFQENFLFNATLRENIRIANPQASQEQIEFAARQAGIHDFISHLPDGYETVAGGSIRFSGGQRQRLAIARALLRNPEILILDEATSALDNATEALINQTIEEVSKGRTVLSVTHRLGSAKKADCIFFLDQGQVKEQGTHEELLALEGGYARLWNKQSGFQLSEDGAQASIEPARLRGISILSDLEENVLAQLSREFTTETYTPGSFILHEGDPGNRFLIIARGTVEILKNVGGSPEPKRVQVLQDGDYFGELALILNVPRTASARSLAASTCLVLTREKFQRLMERVPALRWKLREAASIAGYREAEAGSAAAPAAISDASRIRHDLLTPVNHLVGYSELLAESCEDAGDESGRARSRSLFGLAKQIQAAIDEAFAKGTVFTPGFFGELRRPVNPLIQSILDCADQFQPAEGGIEEDLQKLRAAAVRLSELLKKTPQSMLGDALVSHSTQGGNSMASASISAAGSARLLVVDDNEASRELLCRRLEREGYATASAGSGSAAIEMLSSGGFDLVLLDVLMPDMDGFEILRRLKSSNASKDVPVIMTSAMDEVQSAVRCIELGAEDYMTKPFQPLLLRARIRASIERSRNRYETHGKAATVQS